MKRLVALMLALLMLLGAAAALAEDEENSAYYRKIADGYYALLDSNGNVTNYLLSNGDSEKNPKKQYWILMDADEKILDGEYGELHYDAKEKKWYNEKGKEVSAPAWRRILGRAKMKNMEKIWYTNNTVCVVGLSLRDEYPGLTSKWYNVLPVDISKDGTQTFKLAASNMYYMGTVTVTVAGDNITTNYEYLNVRGAWMEPLGDCLAWFTSRDQLTHAYLENPTPNAQFGQAVSRSKDLKGQNIALLFICNRLTYRTPLNDEAYMPIRFWRNHYALNDYYAHARALMAAMEEKPAANP